MNGVLRLATGRLASCDREDCETTAMEVVGALHLCTSHAWEEEQFWKGLSGEGEPREEAR